VEREKQKRPGYLTDYARHAGISKTAAAKQLEKVGIDYFQPFSFDDADRRRQAARSASRAHLATPIHTSLEELEEAESQEVELDGVLDGAVTKDPVFAKAQAQKEHYRAELARLQFEQLSGKLVDVEHVKEDFFRIARQVRDGILNVPARIAGIVAAETDQQKVHILIEAELRQALESLTQDLSAT